MDFSNAAGSGYPPEHILKPRTGEQKQGNNGRWSGMEYYTVDQIFWGLVALLIIWFLVTDMAGSLFQWRCFSSITVMAIRRFTV